MTATPTASSSGAATTGVRLSSTPTGRTNRSSTGRIALVGALGALLIGAGTVVGLRRRTRLLNRPV